MALNYAALTDWIAGEGAAAWELHALAQQQLQAGKDVIVMSVGDPDFDTPKQVIEQAVTALRDGDTHYADVRGRESLRQAIAQRFQQRNKVACDADNVVVLPGAQCALFSSLQCLAGPGDEVIVPEPMYVTYEASVQATGASMVRVAQPASRGFRPDLEQLAAAINARTKVIFITTPNNPTGVVLNSDELGMIAERAIEHGCWVLADEVYAEVVFDTPHLSIASLPGMAERTVTVSSLSKSHAMTGWRMGWAIGPKSIATHLENLALCMLYGLPGFIQQAAVTALCDPAVEQTLQQLHAELRKRRDFAYHQLSQLPRLHCVKPQGGMFMLIDVRGTGLSAKQFAWRLYDNTGVAVLDAQPFGASSQGYIRLSFAINETSLQRACQRIGDFVNSLKF